MDPVMNYQMGKIRQQEFIDQAARDRAGEAIGLASRVSHAFRLVRATVGKTFSTSASPAVREPECPEQANLAAHSR